MNNVRWNVEWKSNENNIKYKWSFEQIVSFLGKDLDDIRDSWKYARYTILNKKFWIDRRVKYDSDKYCCSVKCSNQRFN